MTELTEAGRSDTRDYRESAFDPSGPTFTEDPHQVLNEVHSSCPVAHSDQFGGFWALTRRADIVEAAKHHDVFINSVTHVVSGRKMSGPHTRPLMHVDRPVHTWFTDVMHPVLNGSIGEEILPAFKAEAAQLVAALVAKGGSDLVNEAAGLVMGSAITQIFHVDTVAPQEFDHWLQRYILGGQINDIAIVEEANEKLYAVARDLVADRRKHPRDPENDLAAALVQATDPEGKPLNDILIQGALRQPFLIVWLATSHSLVNMLEHLVTDQELQATLRADPALIAESVDEVLHMDQPQLGFGRSAACDFELNGILIKEGEAVALVFPSGNRDPEVFDDPETFKIGRYPGPHLAFGAGIHSCPGKSIAKYLVRYSLEAIINGTGSLTADGPAKREEWPFRAALAPPAVITAPSAVHA